MPTSSEPPKDPFLRTVAEHWLDLLALADEAQTGALRALAGAADRGPEWIRARVADLVVEILPLDHPVVAALDTRRDAGTGVAPVDVPSVERLLELVGELVAEEDVPPAGDEVVRRITAQLLDLPAVAAEELLAAGVDPGRPGLIRLPTGRGGGRLPRFQFAGSGRPHDVVLRVNELLDAAHDPWGAASWWVSPHARLDGAPVRLIGRDDELLLRAARAVETD